MLALNKAVYYLLGNPKTKFKYDEKTKMCDIHRDSCLKNIKTNQ